MMSKIFTQEFVNKFVSIVYDIENEVECTPVNDFLFFICDYDVTATYIRAIRDGLHPLYTINDIDELLQALINGRTLCVMDKENGLVCSFDIFIKYIHNEIIWHYGFDD